MDSESDSESVSESSDNEEEVRKQTKVKKKRKVEKDGEKEQEKEAPKVKYALISHICGYIRCHNQKHYICDTEFLTHKLKFYKKEKKRNVKKCCLCSKKQNSMTVGCCLM